MWNMRKEFNPNEIATKEFIKTAIEDMECFIEAIEHKYSIILKGDRSNLQDPYKDCAGLTIGQVMIFFSIWKEGIIAKTEGRPRMSPDDRE